MSKRKPDNPVMADKLKPLREKLAADEQAEAEALKKAKARAKEEAERARAEREEKLTDDERFERAVAGMGRKEVISKFQERPDATGKVKPPAKTATDDEVFLKAMANAEVASVPKDKGRK